MKVKHLFLAAVAAVFTFTACQEKLEDLGEPNIDLSTATLEFEQGASSQTITINATRAWKANDVADWIVVEPASGKASKEDQTVTITVLENTDMNRSCTIEFFAGIVSGYLTVNQAGPGGGVEEGDGSLEHPYLASQANAIASALESGAEDGPYYIKGFVKKFASKHVEGVTNFGNALFYITDTKDGEGDDFYCYQVYYLGGKKFTSLDQIKEGDEVIVYGKITNYNGTCETVGKGAAYIYSLNGEIGDDSGPVQAVDATVTQVIEEQNTAVTYRLSGTVSRFNSQYCSFDLTDETGSIYVYSVTADTKEEYSTKLANGDTVTIEGEYQFYSKTSQHEIVNAKITAWTKGTDDGGGQGGDVDPITGDNLLVNGGFETWTGEKPASWDFVKGNATLTKSSDAKEGSNACEVSGSAESNLRLMSKEYVLLPGTYQIQSYIKGEGQYRVGYTILVNGAPKDSDSYIYVDQNPVQATSDWTLHTVEFTLTAQTSVSVTIMNSKKGAGKSIFVDDVKLVTSDGGLVNGGDGGDDGGDTGGDTPGEFTSSLDKPASASAALAYAQTLADGVQVEAYVKGIICKIDELSTQYGNATYWISDDGTDNKAFEIYRGYYLNGEKFTSEDQLTVGDEVVVFGNIVNFKGNTPEMTTGSIIMSINGQGGSGDDGGQGGGDDWQNASAKTVAEFLAAADPNTYYKLTGTVSNFGATYCNFDLTDATGTVYVYSVKNKDQWSTKIHKGGTVTLAGKYSYYKDGNQEEVIDAYIISYDASTETGAETLSHPLTSNIKWTLGTNSYDNTGSGNNKQTATVNGQNVDNLLKLSTSKAAGNATFTIPSGCTKIGFYACGWQAADLTVGSETVSFKKNAGCTGNAPYTLELSDADYYEVPVTSGSVTVSCPTRVLIIGVNPVE